jgi:hypothetical protein
VGDVARLQWQIERMGWLPRRCTRPAATQGSRSEPVRRDVCWACIEDALSKWQETKDC